MTRAGCVDRQRRALKREKSGKWGAEYALRACIGCEDAVPLDEGLPPRANPNHGRKAPAPPPVQPNPEPKHELDHEKYAVEPKEEAPPCKCGRGPQVKTKAGYYMGKCRACMTDSGRKAAETRMRNAAKKAAARKGTEEMAGTKVNAKPGNVEPMPAPVDTATVFGRLLQGEVEDIKTALDLDDECQIKTHLKGFIRVATTMGEAGLIPGWE